MTAILGAGDHHRQIKTTIRRSGQQLGNVPLDHALGKALAMAVLPTPASPTGRGCSSCAAEIWHARSISFSRPMTGRACLGGPARSGRGRSYREPGFRFCRSWGLRRWRRLPPRSVPPRFGSFGTFDAVAQQVEDSLRGLLPASDPGSSGPGRRRLLVRGAGPSSMCSVPT